MNYPRVASRYSKALLELAVEKNELDKVSADVATLKAAVSGSRDLELLLASPIVKTDKKQAILNEVFKGAFSPIFEGFVSLITKNGRESILIAICEKFEKGRQSFREVIMPIKTFIPMSLIMRTMSSICSGSTIVSGR